MIAHSIQLDIVDHISVDDSKSNRLHVSTNLPVSFVKAAYSKGARVTLDSYAATVTCQKYGVDCCLDTELTPLSLQEVLTFLSRDEACRLQLAKEDEALWLALQPLFLVARGSWAVTW